MKRSRKKLVLYSVAAVWAGAMLALSPKFIAMRHETRSLEQTFDGYSRSLVSGDYETAYKHCGAAFQAAMPYDDFVRLYKSLQDDYGPLKSTKQVAYEIHGSGTPMFWSAVVDADFVYERKSLRFKLVFHKERDGWTLFGAEQT